MSIKNIRTQWEYELNNLFMIFNYIKQIEKHQLTKNKKIHINIQNPNYFLRTSLRHKFILNIERYASIKDEKINKKIKYYSDLERKKLIAITAYNALISEKLKSNNIKFLVYKGITLSLMTKRSITGRPCNDIDILVEKKNVLKIINLLKEIGFEMEYGIITDRNESLIHKYYSYSNKYLIMSKKIKDINFNLKVDLHWEIITTCPGMLDFSILWKNKKILNMNDNNIYSLSPKYLFITLCYNSAKNKWNNLNNLLDISLILNQLTLKDKDILSKNNVIKKTYAIIHSITKDDQLEKYFFKNINYKVIYNSFIKNQLENSKSRNKIKKVNTWKKVSMIYHRANMCNSYIHKIRIIIISLIPISLFISKDNKPVINPLLILKNLFKRLCDDTLNYLKIIIIKNKI